MLELIDFLRSYDKSSGKLSITYNTKKIEIRWDFEEPDQISSIKEGIDSLIEGLKEQVENEDIDNYKVLENNGYVYIVVYL